MPSRPRPSCRQITEEMLLVRFPEASDVEANRAAVALAEELRRGGGVRDAIPGARSLAVSFDPDVVSGDALARSCERMLADTQAPTTEPAAEHVRKVPVLYGGAAGPDLATLSRQRGMPPEEFAARHAAGRYEVAFLGFAPGFAYLTGLAPELSAPRLDTPRTRVPAGSVAIGGRYTGIYPGQSPGGWRLIGRAAVRLFDPGSVPPALLRPGQLVRFEAVGEREFERALAASQAEAAPEPVGSAAPLARVRTPGVWTSIQGRPRSNLGRWGIPPGGALDEDALTLGNALVANRPAAPALEMSFVGPELEWLRPTTVAIAGAAVSAELDGRPVAQERPFRVGEGATLRIGRLRGSARAYLCVTAGFESASMPQPSRRLDAGDVVRGGDGPAAASRGAAPARSAVLAAPDASVVRVVLGPDEDRFTPEGIATFLSGTFHVSAASDRRGIRLEGPAIAHRGEADVPPEGTPLGGIQVPPDGQPIVLGPDRPVTGGYARIATIVSPDFPTIGRALAGSSVRFRAVSLAEAVVARSKLFPTS
jgi:KipI family sensor histidine kinase inhibitor